MGEENQEEEGTDGFVNGNTAGSRIERRKDECKNGLLKWFLDCGGVIKGSL
jgi:hypothetical protein